MGKLQAKRSAVFMEGGGDMEPILGPMGVVLRKIALYASTPRVPSTKGKVQL
jgi:hypothetical protein